MSGDSALLIERPEVDREPGRVVVAPAWTKGNLWGGSDQSVVAALADAITQWRSAGRDVVALASSPDDDGLILEIDHAVGGQRIPFVRGYVEKATAIETIASADIVIGERLHACVLAAAADTPFVPIEYRPKLRDFAASVGVEELVIRSDQLSGGNLVERAESALARGTDEIGRHVSDYRRRLAAAGRLVERAVTA